MIKAIARMVLYPWVRFRLWRVKRSDYRYWSLLVISDHLVCDLLQAVQHGCELSGESHSWATKYNGTLEKGLDDRWFHLRYKDMPENVTTHDLLVTLKTELEKYGR